MSKWAGVRTGLHEASTFFHFVISFHARLPCRWKSGPTSTCPVIDRKRSDGIQVSVAIGPMDSFHHRGPKTFFFLLKVRRVRYSLNQVSPETKKPSGGYRSGKSFRRFFFNLYLNLINLSWTGVGLNFILLEGECFFCHFILFFFPSMLIFLVGENPVCPRASIHHPSRSFSLSL
jgi:hypothetical protein